LQAHGTLSCSINVTHRPHDFYDLFRTLYPYLSLCQVFVSYFAYKVTSDELFIYAVMVAQRREGRNLGMDETVKLSASLARSF
jgi:hypothetical protein